MTLRAFSVIVFFAWQKCPFFGVFVMQLNKTEVEEVRVKITLACQDCKQRNYNMTKDKRKHPDRMETKKYCRFCKAHTMHKETK